MHKIDEKAARLLEENGFRFNFMDGWFQIVQKSEPKPRTKAVYEKVDSCSDTQLASMFVDGLLYFMDLSTEPVSYCPVTCINELACYAEFYRKVEKEIDWRDEIPIGGILCRVRIDGLIVGAVGITSYDDGVFTDKALRTYSDAEPMTHEEIKVYLDNAPK